MLLALSSVWADPALPNQSVLVQPNDSILIFGDSISVGKGYGYQAVKMLNQDQPDLKLTWIEHGHSGWLAKTAVTALADVLAKQPTLVTIMFGTNDLGSGGAKGVIELKNRIRALVEPLLKAGVRVVLLTPPYMGDTTPHSKEFNRSALPRMGEEIIALGKELTVPVFDMFTAMKQAEMAGQAQDPMFRMFNAPDLLHPNATGHQLMARALADFLLGKSTVNHTPFVWHYSGTPTATATFAEKPADAAAVRGVQPMVLNRRDQVNDLDRWKGPADLSAIGYAAWDQTALYLTVDVTEDVVMAGAKQPAWDYDGIEFFFDTRPRNQRDVVYAPGYFQMLVGVSTTNGPAPVTCGGMDKLDATAVTATCRRSDGKYRLQVTVPWEQLRFTPTSNAELGFDFALNHKNQVDKPRYKALWRGQGDDYINAGATGVLRLQK